MQRPINPDSRPLPSGWNQHYDAQRRTWYYIYMNVRPPQVSIIHPLGPIPPASPSTPGYTSDMLDPQNPDASLPREGQDYRPRSAIIQPRTSGLSPAQQLYASSVKSNYHSSPPTIPAASIPTPPTSPPLGHIMPTTAAARFPISPTSRHDFYNTALPTQYAQSRYGIQNTFDPTNSQGNVSAPLPQKSVPHHTPHRTQSQQPASTIYQYDSSNRRTSTLMIDTSKPRVTPSLKTTLRPPPNTSQSLYPIGSSTTPAFQTAAVPLPQLHLQYPTHLILTPTPSHPTPPNSNPSPTLNATTYTVLPASQPLSHLPPIPIHQIPQNYVPQHPAIAPSPPQNVGHQTGTSFTDMGKNLGNFALSIAGGALAASVGLPLGTVGGVGGAIGGALADGNNDFVSSLVDGLSNLGTSGNPAQPPPGTQGQPTTNYQNLISGSMQQQAYSGLNTDYQRQYQTFSNAQTSQTNAIQEAAQVQNMQAAYQVAYQQQQQVQMQMQVQQQMQMQQQLQQLQTVYGQPPPNQPQNSSSAQEPSPLGTFLTGVGQVLSSLAESNSDSDTGTQTETYSY